METESLPFGRKETYLFMDQGLQQRRDDALGGKPRGTAAEREAPRSHLALFAHVEGSKYGAGLFPSTTLPDGQVAHFYHWGQSTHAPIDPPAEEDDPAPVTLLALGLHIPSLPPPPAPVYGDLPNLFKPRSPKCPVPYTHSLPVEPHLCLRDACSLYGSIPGETMRLEAEERQHPPAVEVPLPKTPGDDGYFSWRLDDAIFKQRKRWADAREFQETDRCRHAAFQADWSRCCQDRLVHLVVEADDGDDAHDDELSINTSEMDEVRQVLKQHCAQLYQAFDWYCAEGVAAAPATPLSGARDDFFQIDLPSFVQLCREAGIVDEGTCSLREIEETFVWANKENGADLQDKLAGQLGSAAALASAASAAGINDDSSLMRYEFLLALVKLAITKYLVGGATKDVSTALEMLMTENIAQLPAEATEEALDFRERELYTQQTEAIFLRDLPSLRCLFECYADGGGGGRADLISVSEFDQLLTHTRLYDAEFTRREAVRAFARARMCVVDELKHRNKLIHLSFVDFLEALLRIACVKRMPTDEQMARAQAATAGSFFLKLGGGVKYSRFMFQHREHCAAINDNVGQKVSVALEKLLSTMLSVIADNSSSGNLAMHPQLSREDINDFYDKVTMKRPED